MHGSLYDVRTSTYGGTRAERRHSSVYDLERWLSNLDVAWAIALIRGAARWAILCKIDYNRTIDPAMFAGGCCLMCSRAVSAFEIAIIHYSGIRRSGGG